MTLTGINRTTYRLGTAAIGSGGEGDIYSVLGMEGKVAKIYKPGAMTDELEEKLKYMVQKPPSEAVLSQVAWPLDVVYDKSGKCSGFIMPGLHINAELGEIYKYPSVLPLSASQKINIAQNICAVIAEVHQAGYVFGDFNPRNIGLDKNTGLVSFLDTDTYHVMDSSQNKTYRCNVCAPGYAAPELLERCSEYVAKNPTASKNAYAQTPLPTFTQETDNFALAIHIFKLIMNGYTPFGGIIETASVSQSSPGVGDAAVRRDSYCFKPGYKHQSAAILPLESLPQEIADLFTRAFILGKIDPKQRPSAEEWHGALTRYADTMVTCGNNPLHQYDKKNTTCPLCEADNRYAAIIGAPAPAPTIKQAPYTPPQEPVQTPIPQYQPAQVATPPPKLKFKKYIAAAALLVAIVPIAIAANSVNEQSLRQTPVVSYVEEVSEQNLNDDFLFNLSRPIHVIQWDYYLDENHMNVISEQLLQDNNITLNLGYFSHIEGDFISFFNTLVASGNLPDVLITLACYFEIIQHFGELGVLNDFAPLLHNNSDLFPNLFNHFVQNSPYFGSTQIWTMEVILTSSEHLLILLPVDFNAGYETLLASLLFLDRLIENEYPHLLTTE